MGKLIDYINSLPLENAWYEIFGYSLPVNKFSCPNPEHKHASNTPSCKVYGNKFKCFGQCNRMFGVYDLYKWFMPERIEEIKSTVVLPQQSVKHAEAVTKLQRLSSKEEIIKDLIWLSKQSSSTTEQK